MRLDYRSPSAGCQDRTLTGASPGTCDRDQGRAHVPLSPGSLASGTAESCQQPGATPLPAARSTLLGPVARLASHPGAGQRAPTDVASAAPPAESWGAYIETFPWEWFVTLTFRGYIGEWGAERKFRRLVQQMRHDAGHRVEWLRVTEWHKFRNVPHYHALMLDVKQLRRMRYVDWWWGHGYGNARFIEYDTRLGAGHYLGKYLSKQNSDLSVSRGLKRFAAGVIPEAHTEKLT
jgi:hypothetical protein